MVVKRTDARSFHSWVNASGRREGCVDGSRDRRGRRRRARKELLFDRGRLDVEVIVVVVVLNRIGKEVYVLVAGRKGWLREVGS